MSHVVADNHLFFPVHPVAHKPGSFSGPSDSMRLFPPFQNSSLSAVKATLNEEGECVHLHRSIVKKVGEICRIVNQVTMIHSGYFCCPFRWQKCLLTSSQHEYGYQSPRKNKSEGEAEICNQESQILPCH